MRHLLFVAALLAPQVAAAELIIRITGGEFAARPIAIVPFAQPAEAGLDLAGVVRSDLKSSGLFDPLAPAAMVYERPTDSAQVNFRNWRALAVDHVVVGQVRRVGGKLTIRFQLLDVLRASLVETWNMGVPDEKRLRPVGHQIADILYEKITGVPGYFNSQIAYVTASGQGKARRFQIFIADADGLNPVSVTQSSEPLMSPAWSPDRRKLAYVSFERGKSLIYVHTLATGELKTFSQEPGINGAPAWSPDGRELAVTLSYERNPDLYVIDVATGARRQITRHFAIDTEPAWSPDGRQLAFTSDRGGQPQVYVVSAWGGEPRRLTFEGKQNLRPSYSPDGRSLVLVNVGDQGRYRIGLLDLATRELRLVSDGPLDESPSFAPNGAVVIYATQGEQGAELATVTVNGRFRQRLSQSGDVRDPAWSTRIR